MVLADLGSKLTAAISTMANAVVIDDEAIDKMTNTISLALLQGDVDVQLVRKMKNNIKAKLQSEESGAGNNKRKMVEYSSIESYVCMALLSFTICCTS
jgi:signal recognition particle subunit SRP54